MLSFKICIRVMVKIVQFLHDCQFFYYIYILIFFIVEVGYNSVKLGNYISKVLISLPPIYNHQNYHLRYSRFYSYAFLHKEKIAIIHLEYSQQYLKTYKRSCGIIIYFSSIKYMLTFIKLGDAQLSWQPHKQRLSFVD